MTSDQAPMTTAISNFIGHWCLVVGAFFTWRAALCGTT